MWGRQELAFVAAAAFSQAENVLGNGDVGHQAAGKTYFGEFIFNAIYETHRELAGMITLTLSLYIYIYMEKKIALGVYKLRLKMY